MQLRLIIPKVAPVKLAWAAPQEQILCFLSAAQRPSPRKTQWWKGERCALTGRAKRSASLGPSTPVSSCRLWTGGSSRPSIWRCRREPSSPRHWGSHKHRHVLDIWVKSQDLSCSLFYAVCRCFGSAQRRWHPPAMPCVWDTFSRHGFLSPGEDLVSEQALQVQETDEARRRDNRHERSRQRTRTLHRISIRSARLELHGHCQNVHADLVYSQLHLMVSHRTPGHYAAAATHVNQDCYAHLFSKGPVSGTRHRPVTVRPYTTHTRHLLAHSPVGVNWQRVCHGEERWLSWFCFVLSEGNAGKVAPNQSCYSHLSLCKNTWNCTILSICHLETPAWHKSWLFLRALAASLPSHRTLGHTVASTNQ